MLLGEAKGLPKLNGKPADTQAVSLCLAVTGVQRGDERGKRLVVCVFERVVGGFDFHRLPARFHQQQGTLQRNGRLVDKRLKVVGVCR